MNICNACIHLEHGITFSTVHTCSKLTSSPSKYSVNDNKLSKLSGMHLFMYMILNDFHLIEIDRQYNRLILRQKLKYNDKLFYR